MASLITPATVMNLLWAFEIVPIEGETRPDPKHPQFIDSIIACVQPFMRQTPLTTLVTHGRAPVSFRCQLRPRSEKVVQLIHEATIGA